MDHTSLVYQHLVFPLDDPALRTTHPDHVVAPRGLPPTALPGLPESWVRRCWKHDSNKSKRQKSSSFRVLYGFMCI